jgi:H+-transporting ATPase
MTVTEQPEARGMSRETASLRLDDAGTLSVADVLARLATRPEGLTPAEAAVRLQQSGPNAIEEHHVSSIVKFLLYFWGPIPWMIEIAAVLSAVVHHWPDLGIICVLLVFNAVLGFWQEHKADNAIALLKQKLALTARVRRGGAWTNLPARELVPGDIARVRLGDIIPADVKLIRGDYLQVDQSALTGESLPVEKRTPDVAYSGSIVHRGEADAVVVATGMNTYFGKTARLVQQAKSASHYQKAVLKIGHFLIMLTVALVAVIILVALFRGTPLLQTVQFCLILTVAAIPVALPAVLSVTMAVGAVQLSRRQAIVSRLVSIEEMAGMDLLCSDKTGTLTQNRLVLGEPTTFAPLSTDELVTCAALASQIEDQDPIELAIFQRLPGGPEALQGYVKEAFQPFDPVSKRTEARVRHGAERYRVSKGAPQAILAMCRDADRVRAKVTQAVGAMAARGYRALGVARTGANEQWEFLGLLPLFDPPREDSAATIQAANEMGVAVKMVTGDHLAIASETARQLHLSGAILPADEVFRADKKLDEEKVEAAAGFAQVYPEHKYAIVEALQKRGHFVGMTGDGVNDAPALKKADMGIAVAGATDAARSAADLVLTAPGLSVIIHAVKESRRIFERMNSYAIYRIAETVRVLLFMTLSILIFNFYPVTAVMIIILALLNDGPIMMIAYDHADVAPQPTRWRMPTVLTTAIVLGVLGLFASFFLFWLGENVLKLDRETIRTLMFLKLTVAGHMTIYLARTGPHHFWRRPLPAGLLFWTAELTQLAATLFAVYGWLMTPIGWKLALLVWGYALGWFVVNDLVKVHAVRLLAHRARREGRHLDRIHRPLHPAGAAGRSAL